MTGPPTDIIASALIPHAHLAKPAQSLFNAYSFFLSLLADQESRQRLESATPAAPPDPVVGQAFDATREFSEALVAIFFDEPSGIGELTRRYGVF